MNRIKSVSILAALLWITGCATTQAPTGLLDSLRAEMAALEAETELAGLVPVAVSDARNAVRRAAVEGLAEAERNQRIWLARKTIEIARAEGFAERARRELRQIEEARMQLILRASRSQAMTAEEERAAAARQAEQAREDAEQARRLAEAQSAEIELARREAELASETAASLQRRLEYMEYRETDRGVVITLGDVLFEVGRAELLPGARQNIDDVIELLETEPGKRIRIEGHTDATGPAALNLRLSQQRAEAVRSALVERGIDPSRMDAVGMGEDFPIASNETEDGRASNRRVDVILLND